METHQNQPLEHSKQILLEWTTPEFIPLPRGKTWYMIAGCIVFILILYAAMSGSATMVILIVLLAGLFLFIENKPPRQLCVSITDLGVQYGKEFYPYHHISAFWTVYHPPYVRSLYLKIRMGRRFKYLKIELDHQAPQDVRNVLLKEVPELEGGQELFTDLVTRILRLQ